MSALGAPEWLLLAVILLSAGLLWRGRRLEQRILALERSLGAFATLGGAAGPIDDEELLRCAQAFTDSLLQEVTTSETPLREMREA